MACIRLYSCSLCDNQEECKENKETHNKTIIADRMAKVKHKVLVMSNKGGVGKSTVSANLAASLALKGYRVGIADADIHGPNIPKMFGAEGKRLKITDAGIQPYEAFNLKIASIAFLMEGTDEPIVWRDVWKYDFLQQLFGSFNWGELDYLIVDLPPGTGNESITTIELVNKVGGVVIVTTPQDVALLDSRRSVTFSKINNLPIIGIVENMAGLTCPHCGKDVEVFKIGGGERAAVEMGVPFLGRIPIDPMIAVKADSGEPYIIAYPDSPVGEIFQEIVDKCDKFVNSNVVNVMS
ncbi:MAG: Mrp/NBP35 family ATP-binding protein [Deltaproteobacteria bacterium]